MPIDDDRDDPSRRALERLVEVLPYVPVPRSPRSGTYTTARLDCAEALYMASRQPRRSPERLAWLRRAERPAIRLFLAEAYEEMKRSGVV